MSISSPSTPGISLPGSFGSPSTPTTPGGAQQRLHLKQMAIDTWSLKEQLGLASAVLRSGDQNWVRFLALKMNALFEMIFNVGVSFSTNEAIL